MSSLSSRHGRLLLLAEQILQLDVIEFPDSLAQVVEQFEHGERLFGRPGDGDFNGERPQMGGQRRVWRLGHDLAPRRRRERCSARSWASLRR